MLIPIVQIKTQKHKYIHSEIVKQSTALIQLYKDFHEKKKGTDNRIQHRIDYLIDGINDKVYELYGVNKKDIEIIKKAIE